MYQRGLNPQWSSRRTSESTPQRRARCEQGLPHNTTLLSCFLALVWTRRALLDRLPQYLYRQFERTLIIAEEGAYVSYLEGCTAPAYDTNQVRGRYLLKGCINNKKTFGFQAHPHLGFKSSCHCFPTERQTMGEHRPYEGSSPTWAVDHIPARSSTLARVELKSHTSGFD